ncbi:unnamed protein product [Rhizoctonia solani]|nr:unnamed protein product [Rhizoctonia solani]
MTLLSLLLVALGICHQVAAWGLLVPTHILGKTYLHWWGKSLIGPNEERQRVQVEITNKDGGGYNWPYQFEVWKNASGKADERIHLQDVRATPVFWDNNQPVGTFIRFRFKDVNRFVFGSEFIQVELTAEPYCVYIECEHNVDGYHYTPQQYNSPGIGN